MTSKRVAGISPELNETASIKKVQARILLAEPVRDAATLYWMQRAADQDMSHGDMAEPRTLNEIIWFSAFGSNRPMPEVARLPICDAMIIGGAREDDDERKAERSAARHKYSR